MTEEKILDEIDEIREVVDDHVTLFNVVMWTQTAIFGVFGMLLWWPFLSDWLS